MLQAIEKASYLFTYGVFPELIGKMYTREPMFPLTASLLGSDSSPGNCWCFCRKGEEEGDMIGYDNPNCPIKWFHVSCLKLKRIPTSNRKWYCPDCRKSKIVSTKKKQ